MTTTTTPARSIKIRRVRFRYDDEPLPRHFMAGGDPAMSHIVAVLSSLFPEGEDFFVKTVRDRRDQITDPELRKQVGGFIGQEAIHGREHRELNQRLQAMGYPTRFIDRVTKHGLALLGRVAPADHQLAVTAALEHYTSTLAEILLGDERAREIFGDSEVLNLLSWHAIEESEHKSVAFDVFQAVCGKHRVRAGVMDLTTVGFLAGAIAGTVLSMALDGSTWRHPVRTARSIARLRTSPWLSKDTRRRIRDYNRRDFHPEDHDATALLDRWRDELFGADGALADRVKAGAAA